MPTRVEIGNGLGAGNKPEIAREAAEAAVDKINQLFDDHTKMVFITAEWVAAQAPEPLL